MKSLFTEIFLLILICIALGNMAVCESNLPDISQLSIEELLLLQDNIDIALKEKGYKVYFDIERGTKGENVSEIQERLSELGYYTGKITGKYDSETQKAFKLFEKSNGLQNDGLASREDQSILFDSNAVPKSTPSPAATTPEQKATSAPEQEHDTNFDYEQCMRFPDNYIGQKYTLKGKVVQTLGNRQDGFEIRFAVLGNSEEVVYVYINHDPGYNILENDWLIIDLTMASTVTYESIWRQEITIPAAIAGKVILK